MWNELGNTSSEIAKRDLLSSLDASIPQWETRFASVQEDERDDQPQRTWGWKQLALVKVGSYVHRP